MHGTHTIRNGKTNNTRLTQKEKTTQKKEHLLCGLDRPLQPANHVLFPYVFWFKPTQQSEHVTVQTSERCPCHIHGPVGWNSTPLRRASLLGTRRNSVTGKVVMKEDRWRCRHRTGGDAETGLLAPLCLFDFETF